MPSDVAEGGGAEKGVAEGVEKGIGVGMTVESGRMRDCLSSKDEGPALAEGVDVKTRPDAHRCRIDHQSPFH